MNTRFRDSLIALMASYIGLIFYYSVNHDPPSIFYNIASIVIIIGCFIRSLYLFYKEAPKKHQINIFTKIIGFSLIFNIIIPISQYYLQGIITMMLGFTLITIFF
ncbi:hypothetical protein BWX42_05735 [Dolosigranulum pigrum]|uniref:Uncharacterized protein n=1 Tax=Dolosigranulum pigrum TaxID=29394 RepID=A0A1S8KNN3_9LACT|nr:hypothetical protein BWX42_05735 [Dolosigranulum pigrum]